MMIASCKGISNGAGGIDVTIECTVPEKLFPLFRAAINGAFQAFADRCKAKFTEIDHLKPAGGAN